MSFKGHEFNPSDMSDALRLKSTPQEQAAWCAENTARYKVVATDLNGEEIIAEEVIQRALNVLSPKARRVAGLLIAADLAVRAEVLAAFAKDGALKLPFKAI